MVNGGWMTALPDPPYGRLTNRTRLAHESSEWIRFQILPTVGSRIVVRHCLRFVISIAIWKRRTYIQDSIVINLRCLIFQITRLNLEYIKCKVVSDNHKYPWTKTAEFSPYHIVIQ